MIYKWLYGPENFPGLSRNGPLENLEYEAIGTGRVPAEPGLFAFQTVFPSALLGAYLQATIYQIRRVLRGGQVQDRRQGGGGGGTYGGPQGQYKNISPSKKKKIVPVQKYLPKYEHISPSRNYFSQYNIFNNKKLHFTSLKAH